MKQCPNKDLMTYLNTTKILFIMKKNIFIVFLFLACVTPAIASTTYNRDTIVMRPDHFYFEEWYDTIPSLDLHTPDLCPFSVFSWDCGRHWTLTSSQHTNSRLKVKGLALMASDYVEHPHGYNGRPSEYLLIYQYDASAPDSLVLLDSVRYDTITPRTIAIPYCKELVEYTDLYEVYFKEPIYVDSLFFIGSTGHCQGGLLRTTWMPLEYRLIFCHGATNHNRYKLHHQDYGWIDDFGLNNVSHFQWGPFFAIVDNHNLEAMADTAGRGTVAGGGRFADSSYNAITALPDYGYRFFEWNDGNLDNPRIVHLTQDTLFTASFTEADYFILNTESNNTEWGHTEGYGAFPEQQPITITATPNWGYIFTSWSDGVTDNPRIVYLTQDTLFTAIFAEASYYTITAECENPEWGYVEGTGVFPEQHPITITAIPYTNCEFVIWRDGVTANPRTIQLTQDTQLVAIFWSMQTSSIPDAETPAPALVITPNPAHDVVTVTLGNDWDKSHATLVLRNALGKVIRSITPTTNKIDIPLQGLTSGTYLLTLTTNQGSSTQKLIIE